MKILGSHGKLKRAIGLLFYVHLIVFILLNASHLTNLPKANPAWRKGLLDGSNENYPVLGQPLMPFRIFFPRDARSVSLISDMPYQDESGMIKEFYRMGQGALCPLLVNFEPGEEFAIVITGNPEHAKKRLEETGYEWLRELGQGKGIARKIK
jgi:hypothetical protein